MKVIQVHIIYTIKIKMQEKQKVHLFPESDVFIFPNIFQSERVELAFKIS
jgi:hypothetical protein